jgi:hypothetical protein
MADDSDQPNGFGQPPRHSRFRKGQSGNPRGRPKGRVSFKADLEAELQQKTQVMIDGRPHMTTKQRAVIKVLTDQAIKNDMRAVNALLACVRHFARGPEEPPAENVDADDLEILQNYLERERQRQARSQQHPEVAKDKSS